ncbi:MAG: Type 1 glutamine amidotransferase-like domain-containing protein [Bacteroidota bacterium]|nr:Type 1 glutamine amidotransferase-like domain-containing protein [Bacteroidota bacterium]MDP4252833.1 Type 1 glutamine amidotransferase-like domain-containing protein [Bacteroidota bacterium]MDP4260604.1 Type 1 glutamine amidotransferase-like domain-containing protein [Bacteroidota bacterium]
MKLLLTSAGISNTSIRNALVDLLGKPIAESTALCIPTAIYGLPGGTAGSYRLIHGVAASPLCELGWKSLGVLELTALPSIKEELWVPVVQGVDALLVGGGDPLYLSYWMRQSKLADLLPSLLRRTVYIGVSAGSMVVAPNFGEQTYGGINLPAGDDSGLALVDFAVFSHLDHERFPDHSLINAEIWASKLPVPTYALDDQTAVKVIDNLIEVVSEGNWKLFNPDKRTRR